MKIHIKNRIQFGSETEVVEEIHDGHLVEKGDYTYLTHQNSEDQKVIIKFNAAELIMTRFSNPKSVMRFTPERQALVTIPTPLGTQQLVTDTHFYSIDEIKQVIHLHYSLKQLETNTVFANYQLEVSWN